MKRAPVNLVRAIKRAFSPIRKKRPPHRLPVEHSRSCRIRLEALEDRVTPTGLGTITTDASGYPDRAAVKIWAYYSSTDKWFQGSGTMIDSYHVLTAAHVLYDNDSDSAEVGYASTVVVLPGYSGPGSQDYDAMVPYGLAEGSHWVVPSDYQVTDANRKYDMGLITLDRPIGDITGWFGWAEKSEAYFDAQPTLNIIHYPAEDVPDNGRAQYYTSGKPNSADSDRLYYDSANFVDTQGGSSGAGIYTLINGNRQVVAVHTHGLDDTGSGNWIDSYWAGKITDWSDNYPKPASMADLVDYDYFFDKGTGTEYKPWLRTSNPIHSSISSTSATAGGSFTASSRVYNTGTADATNVKVSFYLSSDTSNGSDIFLGSQFVNVSANSSAQPTWTGSLPTGVTGSYYVCWFVDPDDTVAEYGYGGGADANFGYHPTPINIVAGDTVGAFVTTDSTFQGFSPGTFNQVLVNFNEPLAASNGFVLSDIVSLTGPNGTITPTSVTAAPGGANKVYVVNFPDQSTPGTYTIVLGTSIIDVANNLLNQDLDGVNGENPSDQATITGSLAATDKTGAHIISAVFSGTTANTFDKVRFTYSEAIDLSNSDITSGADFSDPLGNLIFVNSVTAVPGTTNQFDIFFDTQSTPGDYTITTGVQLLDLAGNLLDQNQNGINGELDIAPAGDQFRTKATLGPTDQTGARVLSAAFSGAAPGTLDTVRIEFSEGINLFGSSFQQSSFLDPNGNPITFTSVLSVAGSDSVYDFMFTPQSTPGNYALTIGADVADLAGNFLDQNQNGINGEAEDKFTSVANIGGGGGTSTFFAVAAADGSVQILDSGTGAVLHSAFRPLDGAAQYKGLVQLALGDLNGDFAPDLFVTAANPAGVAGLDASKAGQVFVYDGASFVQSGVLSLLRSFTPFATTDGPAGVNGAYINGLNIAVGDVNGDGTVDLIAGTRGGNGTVGRNEYGRLVVIDGTSPAGSNTPIGTIQKPFGAGYQKGVVVAAGNADGVGGDEVAVTRGGPVASPSPTVQQIKVKVLQLQGGALSELPLAADGSTAFAPFGSLPGAANAIKRDGRVAFVDTDGDGKAELVFTALDPLTNVRNKQVRVGVYLIDTAAGAGAATIVSAGTDAGTYVTGSAVVDHAITHVPGAGTQENLVLFTESASSGLVFLAPLTGTVQAGGFALSVINGGITIDGI